MVTDEFNSKVFSIKMRHFNVKYNPFLPRQIGDQNILSEKKTHYSFHYVRTLTEIPKHTSQPFLFNRSVHMH